MEDIYYCCKCPVVFCSSPLLKECLLCPCNYSCEQDTVWNIEGQLQCMEWMNGFSQEYPCFGTTCGIMMVNYLLMECHGIPWESEECSVYTTCCVASCGLSIDAIICPLYCSYCLCDTCYKAPRRFRRGGARNVFHPPNETRERAASLTRTPNESIIIRDHYISEMERHPPALSPDSSSNEPRPFPTETTACIENALHCANSQGSDGLHTGQETTREGAGEEDKMTEESAGGAPAPHNEG